MKVGLEHLPGFSLQECVSPCPDAGAPFVSPWPHGRARFGLGIRGKGMVFQDLLFA